MLVSVEERFQVFSHSCKSIIRVFRKITRDHPLLKPVSGLGISSKVLVSHFFENISKKLKYLNPSRMRHSHADIFRKKIDITLFSQSEVFIRQVRRIFVISRSSQISELCLARRLTEYALSQ